MTVSLIILTCNRKDSVSALLSDIRRQARQPDEIIVVDNNSSDGTSAYLAMSFPAEVHAVKLEKNMGAAGRNEGIKRVTVHSPLYFYPGIMEGAMPFLPRAIV
jgi:GT2 family glycosyltransferase